MAGFNSNTTLVKVKYCWKFICSFTFTIQIQHLLKLNSQGNRKASENKLIQIQHLLKLNLYIPRKKMSRCQIQIQHLLKLNKKQSVSVGTRLNSNTTLVKVKFHIVL